MLGWLIKEKPLIEATANTSLIERVFMAKKSELMLSVLKAIEMIVMTVERTNAPMAMGVALKTYFKLGR